MQIQNCSLRVAAPFLLLVAIPVFADTITSTLSGGGSYTLYTEIYTEIVTHQGSTYPAVLGSIGEAYSCHSGDYGCDLGDISISLPQIVVPSGYTFESAQIVVSLGVDVSAYESSGLTFQGTGLNLVSLTPIDPSQPYGEANPGSHYNHFFTVGTIQTTTTTEPPRTIIRLKCRMHWRPTTAT
jgi:hypothetical protein